MPLEKFERQQIIPITLTQAWSFFGRMRLEGDPSSPRLVTNKSRIDKIQQVLSSRCSAGTTGYVS